MAAIASRLLLASLACGIAGAAALVPVPGNGVKPPLAGFEPNRGQAKPEILFLSRGEPSLGFTARSVLYSPLNVELTFVASTPDPAVRFTDPLPGVANALTGADPAKWVTGIPRFSGAVVSGVYPGIDAQYTIDSTGRVTLTLLVQPGSNLAPMAFEIAKAVTLQLGFDNSLVARLGPSRLDPTLPYPVPIATQASASGTITRQARYEIESNTRFRIRIDGHDPSLPLQIEMKLGGPTQNLAGTPLQSVIASGFLYGASSVPDAPGKDAPFPESRWQGCAVSIGFPFSCTDVAVYKLTSSGQLVYVTYLSGRTREAAGFLRLTPGGDLMIAGATDSSDFPVTAGAVQSRYAGPPPTLGSSSSPVEGDFFAVRLNPDTGLPRSSTYFGGPAADRFGQAALGADGSLYFLPEWLIQAKAQMPVTPGALSQSCDGDPCRNGYAAHLSASLDRLLYGTYLPGTVQGANLHSDGSVYFAGNAETGFPTTPGAYQREVSGLTDGTVARLNPEGTGLIFATYLGGTDTDWILRMAVAPDGSVWVSLSSFVLCCVDIDHRLVRLDANGQRILAEAPLAVSDIAVDRGGNLIAIADGDLRPTSDAFLANSCGGAPAYVKLNANAAPLFLSYLPYGVGYDFAGYSESGSPLLMLGGERLEVVDNQSMGVYAGCVVDGASFNTADLVSPGAIVTLFGSRLGPREGAVFRLENGTLPTTLGGTRVLINGAPVPLLYTSYTQINLVVPYTLPVATRARIQVFTGEGTGNELNNAIVQQAGISIFRLDGSSTRPAAALNEDGSINSPANPARMGSRVVLFGTGGGPTVPPSIAGEVTPLTLRTLEFAPQVTLAGGIPAVVEYAGAAPGQLAGVTQLNIKLPAAIPQAEGFPKGIVPLSVTTQSASFYPGYVTIAVAMESTPVTN